jgi:hypothetical protein
MFVWGNSKKGIAIVKQRGSTDWDIHHVLNGKVVLVHRDYTKTEALREAKNYAKFEKSHPKGVYLK